MTKKEDKKVSLVRYCGHCGTVLTMKTKPKEPIYDNFTGLPTGLVTHYWKCPNKFWITDSHDEYSDERHFY